MGVMTLNAKALFRFSIVVFVGLLAFGLASVVNAQGAGEDRPAVTYDYKLGSGDRVKIAVFGEDALGGEFAVSGEGKLSLPLIGEVYVQGLTAPQVQVRLQEAYQEGYLREPRVNVEILNFRPFYILGEVKKPGEYPFTNGMTVVNAVALAEGFTYRANQKQVFIRRANGEKEERVPLTSNLLVSPGDTIRIGERYF
jgi:protein involved in polysaccharide export with SLBB domain